MQLASDSPSHEVADEGELHTETLPFPVSFVARTAESLMTYLQAIHQTNLLLFPTQIERKEKFKTRDKRLFEGTIAWHAKTETSSIRTENICLVRVLIQPFHKGVAEVGAVLYSPTSDDYNIWSHM